jgi:hypothetical protein
MTKPLIQIGDEVREMTDAEHTQWLADNKLHEVARQAERDREQARVSALAKLAALGLTEGEISALLGA